MECESGIQYVDRALYQKAYNIVNNMEGINLRRCSITVLC